MSGQRSLVDLVNEQLASENLRLPVYSPVAARIQKVASRDDTSLKDIERLVVQDAALSSSILRVANSALYAGLTKVDTVKGAVLRLGTKQIVQLAVMCAQEGQFRSEDPELAELMRGMWQHSVACATCRA